MQTTNDESKRIAQVKDQGVAWEIKLISPYGLISRAPSGTEVKSINDEKTALALEQEDASLEIGEVKLKSPHGAEIYLKKDGSIEITGRLKITADIEVDGNITATGKITDGKGAEVSHIHNDSTGSPTSLPQKSP